MKVVLGAEVDRVCDGGEGGQAVAQYTGMSGSILRFLWIWVWMMTLEKGNPYQLKV